MSKSIDSIGRKPSQKTANLVENKMSDSGYPSETLRKSVQESSNVPEPKKRKIFKKSNPSSGKKKSRLAFAILILFGLVAVVSYGLMNTRLLTSLSKPKPAAGVYAEVGGETVSIDQYNKLKDVFAKFQKSVGSGKVDRPEQQASQELTRFLALTAEGKKRGIECTQATVDARLSRQYADAGGKDKFYARLSDKYSWTPDISFFQECSTYLEEQLTPKAVSGTDVFGVYIRWDTANPKDTVAQSALETAARTRLEKDYLPLFKSGVSKDEILKTADISKFTSDADFDKQMTNPADTQSRAVEYPRMNETVYAGFQKYDQGERDIDYISKLRVGESTPVFKSQVGYYAIFQATAKYGSDFTSVDQMIRSYTDAGKYSTDYYLLPSSGNSSKPSLDLNQTSKPTSLLQDIQKSLVPAAQAVANNSVGCFSNHALPMKIIYRDYDTHGLIPLADISATKGGAPIATLDIRSTTDMKTKCYDDISPVSGAYGVLNIDYLPGNILHYDIYNYKFNPFEFSLSCYTSWQFQFNQVVGYYPVNYTDASQFKVSLLTNSGAWDVQNRASAGGATTYYRIPGDMYGGIANGAAGYTIEVFMKAVAPIQNPPEMTFAGSKIDEAGRLTGPFSSANVSLDSGALNDNRNPYSITNVRSDQAHTLTAAPVAGFGLIGYKKDGGALVSATTYNYGANDVANGGSVKIDWVYRPIINGSATLTCSTATANVTSPPGTTTYMTIDGAVFATSAGLTLSTPVPDTYKDGTTRTVRLYATYLGVDYLLDTKAHKCNNGAQCGVDNISAVFPNGLGNMTSSGLNVSITMKNVGETIWKNNTPPAGWTSGQYRLVFSSASGAYWQNSSLAMPGGTIADGVSINGGNDYTFKITLQPIASAINTGSIPIEWQMAFVDTSGAIKEVFPATVCKSTVTPTVTLQADYHPWLRIQNGSAAALGAITGQAVGLRGTRNLATPNADLNYDATYVVMAVAGGNNFCSSNAYVFGQGSGGGMNAGCTSTFEGYTFGLQQNQLDGYFDSVLSVAQRGTCTAYDASNPPVRSVDRARALQDLSASTPVGNINAIKGDISSVSGLSGGGGCPAYYKDNSGADYAGTPTPAKYLSKGRAAVLVDNNPGQRLNITGNIIAAPSSSALAYAENGDLNDLAQFMPSLGIFVKGDVYISSSVTQIDAVIYATGKIYTCSDYPATTGTNTAETQAQAANRADNCNKKLVVHGGLYAGKGYAFGRNFFQSLGPDTASLPRSDGDYDFKAITNYYGGPAEDIVGNGTNFIIMPPGLEGVLSNGDDKPTYLQGDFQPRF
ncbi:MAG: hypothetical protein WCI47_03110 [bacterium]